VGNTVDLQSLGILSDCHRHGWQRRGATAARGRYQSAPPCTCCDLDHVVLDPVQITFTLDCWDRSKIKKEGCDLIWKVAEQRNISHIQTPYTLRFHASMTKSKFSGAWNEVKDRMKQKYPGLTDRDLGCAARKDKDQLTGPPRKLRRMR